MKAQRNLFKTCCKELKEAMSYEKATISSPIESKLVFLDLGKVVVSPEEAKRRTVKLMKALQEGVELPSMPKKLSGILPIIKPIKFCPFCGVKISK